MAKRTMKRGKMPKGSGKMKMPKMPGRGSMTHKAKMPMMKMKRGM